MKKLIITSACVIAVAGTVFGQGNVAWNTISPAAMTAQTNTTVYSPYSAVTPGAAISGGSIGNTTGAASVGTGFYYELLIGSVWNGSAQSVPTTLAGFSSWTDSGLQASNNPATLSAGRLVPMAANAGDTLNTMSTTVSNSIILVGWSANLGSTWSTALAAAQAGTWSGTALFGVSTEGYIEALSTSTSPGAALFGTAATSQGLPINSLNTQLEVLGVPEPGTIALAALGGASLLLFRRKK